MNARFYLILKEDLSFAMDTGTHVVMGIALGGLATIDPIVANDPTLFNAVFIGTIVGSQAPDFDTILKFKNNATYIRNHRGLTHSIPAVILWGILIASLIYFIVPSVNFLHLWLWTFLAVILIVFDDIFIAYCSHYLYYFLLLRFILHFFIIFCSDLFFLSFLCIISFD